MSTEVVKFEGPRGTVARKDFTGTEVQVHAETASMAVAARERAATEARYLMAERHPRSWDNVRVKLLAECDRPMFAEVARYAKPVGTKKVNGEWVKDYKEGLSIRFAESAMRCMGNVYPETTTVYEDERIRIVRVAVTDLEANLSYAQEIPIAKVVERRGKKKGNEWEAPEGRLVISSRLNSYGEPTFLVEATDDEVGLKQNSAIAKAQRNFAIKLLPRDIADECEARIIEVINKADKADPTAAKKRLIDSFAKLGVMPTDLVSFVGHSLDNLQPAELQDLRGLHGAIKEGEITFNEALKARFSTPEPGEEETPQQHDARLQRQMDEQAAVGAKIKAAEESNRAADEKKGLKPITEADVAAEVAKKSQPKPEERPLTAEENKALDAEIAAHDSSPSGPRMAFGFKPKK